MLRRNKRSNETVRLKGKRNHLANRKQRKIQKDLFPIGLCWGREPIFSKKTCFITGSSHFYLWWSDIQHLWGLSLCKTFWIMLRQASLWVAGQWLLFFFPSGSLFSWALLMHEYEQPWKAFCLCHKKKDQPFDFGHPGFSSKRAIHLDNTFHLFRVRKGMVIRDAGFQHVRSRLESLLCCSPPGWSWGCCFNRSEPQFPYLPSGAFYSGNKLVQACWED